MKIKAALLALGVFCLAPIVTAQSNPPTPGNATAIAEARTNTAIEPVPRPDPRSRARTDVVLQRAKDNPGECDIVFIGDSITQGWEGAGKEVWNKYYGNRKCLNFG